MRRTKTILCKQCKQSEKTPQLPILKGTHQSLCLNCVILKSSTKYVMTRHLITPVIYISNNQEKQQIFYCHIVPELPDTSAIGFCIIGKQFQNIPNYWPVKSVKIQINGQTFWSKQSNCYKVTTDLLTSAKNQRYLDLNIRVCDNSNTEWILACFELKQMKLTDSIKSELPMLLQKSNEFVMSQYQISKQSKNFDMICPIRLQLINIPIRFRQCKHFQSVDYLNIDRCISDLSGIFKCPYCLTKTNLSSLLIDPKQYRVMQAKIPQLKNLEQWMQKLNSYVEYKSDINQMIGKNPQ